MHKLDPVMLAVVKGRLEQIADEMDATTLAHWLDIRCNQSVI